MFFETVTPRFSCCKETCIQVSTASDESGQREVTSGVVASRDCKDRREFLR